MLADKLEEWAKLHIAEGIEQGIEKGIEQGEILALQKLLAKRFGAIPAEITAQIGNASLEQIEQWFDKAIDAKELNDIFN